MTVTDDGVADPVAVDGGAVPDRVEHGVVVARCDYQADTGLAGRPGEPVDGLPDGPGHRPEGVQQVTGDHGLLEVEPVEQCPEALDHIGAVADRDLDVGVGATADVEVCEDECLPQAECPVAKPEVGDRIHTNIRGGR